MSKLDVNMDSLVSIDLLEPLTKLVEVVANAIGVSYEPKRLIRKAKAEAQAERILAVERAKTNAMLAQDMEQYNQLSIIEKRVLQIEQKRQTNINNIIEVAAQSLEEEKSVSSEPVNPDWATRFFDIAQDISDETMQDLWGRILAGEIKCPKSYSMRTLDVLRNITCEEARLFEKVANFVMYDASYFVYYDSSFRENDKIGLSYEEIAKMTEIGLIQAGGGLVHAHIHNTQGKTITNAMAYGSYVILIEQPSTYEEISFPVYPLTKSGTELFQLISVTPNDDYLKAYANSLKNDYKDLKVSRAQLISIDYQNNEYTYADETIQQL